MSNTQNDRMDMDDLETQLVEHPDLQNHHHSSVPELPEKMVVNIVKYLHVKDQLSCRLIWKGCDDGIKSVVGENLAPILLGNESELNKELLQHLKDSPKAPLPDTIILKLTSERNYNTIRKICDILDAKGSIKKIYVSNDQLSDNARIVLETLSRLSSSLETLIFDWIVPSGIAREAHSAWFADDFYFPSLTKVEFNMASNEKNQTGDELSYAQQNSALFYQLLFTASPKLTCVEEGMGNCNFNFIKVLKSSDRLQQITSLFLHMEEKYLDVFLEYENCDVGGLRIEELNINLFCPERQNVEKMERVLGMLRKKLKVFSSGTVFKTKVSMKLPIMEKLEKLYLKMDGFNMKNLVWKRDTPKLKNLELVGLKKEFLMKNLDENKAPLKVLKTMQLEGHKSGLDEECCAALDRVFPSVSTLVLHYPNRKFLENFGKNGWGMKLTRLELWVGPEIKDCDQALFGISPKLGKKVKEKWWTALNEPTEEPTRIVALQNLKQLLIHGNQGLTELSFFCGLTRMPNLQLLHIDPNLLKKISKDAVKFLKKKLPSLVLTS